jgi:hypothetical protein
MSDYKREFTYRGTRYKVAIWESNKGALGACGWGLWEFCELLGVWYKHAGSLRYYPVNFMRARSDVAYAIINVRHSFYPPIE